MSAFDQFNPANRVLVGHIFKVVLPSGEKYIGVESEDGSMSWTEQVHGTWVHDMQIDDNLALTSEMVNYAFGKSDKVNHE